METDLKLETNSAALTPEITCNAVNKNVNACYDKLCFGMFCYAEALQQFLSDTWGQLGAYCYKLALRVNNERFLLVPVVMLTA